MARDAVLVAALATFAAAAHAQSVEELRQLSIEDLAAIEVTSVSRRPEPLSQAPAAVYVITSEDIRRSGAISLAEILRLAPNLLVARRDALSYAISARGFNSFEAANKLLVLIDGRTVYSSLHAGVFWDQQQLLTADIERIEVISGPGGTLWGANAVNGVINIVTRHSRETQGGLADIRYGTVDQSFGGRYGGRFGETGSWRAYALANSFGHVNAADGTKVNDSWNNRQGGFRTDWTAGNSAFTVQGDVFDNPVDADGRLWGRNILGRWTHRLGGGSALEVQAYYDRVDRSGPSVRDTRETYDISAQHSFSAGERHTIVWGGGHRITSDEFFNGANAFVLSPADRTYHRGNLFLQDTIALADNLKLTLGTKLEYATMSKFDYMPSARLAWSISEEALLWAAVSRAVRTQSRIDRDLVAPGFFAGGPDFESEKLIAYELGYRGRPLPRTIVSVSLYYNDYDDLRTTELAPGGGLPLAFENGLEGETYGVEAWAEWRARPWWRLTAGVNALHKNLRLKSGVVDTSGMQAAGNDPDYQVMLRSAMDLPGDVELDLGLRVVDDLKTPAVPSYTAVDARLGWHATDALELFVAAFNLFDDQHPETGAPPQREIRRSAYLGLRWGF